MTEKLKRVAVPVIAMVILLAFWFGLEVEHRQLMDGDCRQLTPQVNSR